MCGLRGLKGLKLRVEGRSDRYGHGVMRPQKRIAKKLLGSGG